MEGGRNVRVYFTSLINDQTCHITLTGGVSLVWEIKSLRFEKKEKKTRAKQKSHSNKRRAAFDKKQRQCRHTSYGLNKGQRWNIRPRDCRRA